MKKYVLSLLVAVLLVGAGAAVSDAQTPSPTPKATPKPKRDLACMQGVVDKRDASLITTVDGYHTAVITALKARQSALKTAWGKTDRKTRRTDIATAWKTYRQSIKKAREALQSGRKTSWKTFQTARRTCGTAVFSDDGTNEAVDVTL